MVTSTMPFPLFQLPLFEGDVGEMILSGGDAGPGDPQRELV